MIRSTSRAPKRALALLLSVAALALIVPSAASADPIGSVVQLSTFNPTSSSNSCGSSSVATNPTSGVTLAAWAAPTVTGGSSPLQVAVVGANGAAGSVATYQPTDAFYVADPGSCEPISVDAGANGGFLLTWNDGDNDNAIYGILVGSNGAFIGDAFQISEFGTYSDIETVTAAWSAADSRYLVTWKAWVLTPFPAAVAGQQIAGRFVDGTGAAIGGDFLVTNIAQQINNSQDVAYGNGAWVVVGVDNATSTVRSTIVSASGAVGTSAIVPAPVGGGSNGASVAYNAELNQFLIVARASNTMWAQLLDGSGAASGSSFVAATAAGSRPRVTATGANGWLLAWHSNGQAAVNGIALNAAAQPQGAVLAASSAEGGVTENNFRPEISFSATTGEAYLVWTRHLSSTDESNVVARAWYVAPAAVAAVPASPVLAATGVDPVETSALIGGSVLALAAGAVMLLLRRRRTA